MKVTRTGKRRAAAINSVKILLTSASLVATLGGWAAISAANAVTTASDNTVEVALVTTSTAIARPAANATKANASANAVANATATTAATATVAPTATAVPTQVVVQPNVRTGSSK